MKYFVRSKLSEKISETPEGFLLCLDVPIARTGEMEYHESEIPLDPDKNGKIIISRSDKEVFRPETIASFEGKPITITHPTEFVNPESWKNLAVGTMQNIRRGAGEFSDSLLADLMITDIEAINLVKNGLREVSCGYDATYEQDEPGKGVQKFILGNHLALVEQGRAGPSYAINDHKGKGSNHMGLKDVQDKIKKVFAKAGDEAAKMMEDAESLGGKQSPQDPESGKPATADEVAKGYDELKKCFDALASKIDAMKPKDSKEEKPPEKKEGEDADPGNGMEDRMKKLEAAVSKLLEVKAGDAEEEEMEDADEEESEDEMEMSDAAEGTMVGDAATDIASRAEILAPGIELTGKNIKVKALKTAYATKEGKAIIEALNGGKAATFDSKKTVDSLFVSASEVMKARRKQANASTKRAQVRDVDGTPVNAGFKSAEDINAINEKFYKQQSH